MELIDTSLGYYWITLPKIQQKQLKTIQIVNRLLSREAPVFWVLEKTADFSPGDFIVPANAVNNLEEEVEKYGVQVKLCKENHSIRVRRLIRPKIAIYHTGGYRWSLFHSYTLEKFGFTLRLCSAKDIEKGVLEHFNVLIIPGGNSFSKLEPLTPMGREKLLNFIFEGGGCFATCGGAAIFMEGGLNIVKARRDRLIHGLHGPVLIRIVRPEHPIWFGYEKNVIMPVFHGFSFKVLDSNNVLVLGVYDGFTSKSYVWDLRVLDVPPRKWVESEEEYGFTLDPYKMLGTPAILEANYGKGKIILSYPHPEAIDWELSHKFVANAIYYLASKKLPSLELRTKKSNKKGSMERAVLRLEGKISRLKSVLGWMDGLCSNVAYSWVMKYDMVNPRRETFWSRLTDLIALTDECSRHIEDLKNMLKDLGKDEQKHFASVLDKLVKPLDEALEKLDKNLKPNILRLINLKKRIKQFEKNASEERLKELQKELQKLAKKTFGVRGPRGKLALSYGFILRRLDIAFYYLTNIKLHILDLLTNAD
ncbi:MAG: hypothetical protein DRN49_05630 [Thaumarchaeota archaeon]|nr:MAG: hypothetical protein DRN49_05630 [Nitrososphaerota archaeon]